MGVPCLQVGPSSRYLSQCGHLWSHVLDLRWTLTSLLMSSVHMTGCGYSNCNTPTSVDMGLKKKKKSSSLQEQILSLYGF
jgi:hypothetical protein